MMKSFKVTNKSKSFTVKANSFSQAVKTVELRASPDLGKITIEEIKEKSKSNQKAKTTKRSKKK